MILSEYDTWEKFSLPSVPDDLLLDSTMIAKLAATLAFSKAEHEKMTEEDVRRLARRLMFSLFAEKLRRLGYAVLRYSQDKKFVEFIALTNRADSLLKKSAIRELINYINGAEHDTVE